MNPDTDTDTDTLAAETRRLLDAATEGEWRHAGDYYVESEHPSGGMRRQVACNNPADAALIAAAPRLLANWLARNEQTEAVEDDLGRIANENAALAGRLMAERDRLADENRALREAARAVAFCDSCGEPTHEPNEDCWFMDRSSCAYALNPNGGGTCSFDCRDEPSCMTDGPYPMERLRLVLAAADRGVTDGEATTSRRPVQFDAYASNPWPDGEATDG